jgi:hypothetical protein
MGAFVSGLLAVLVLVTPLAAIDVAPHTANVYVDNIDGFGSFLAAAFAKKAVPVVVVADRREADFELVGTAESKQATVTQSILLAQGGSRERASVSLVNLKNGQIVFAYAYNKSYALFGKQSAAESCAKHLREAILKGSVNLRDAEVTAGHHAGAVTSVPTRDTTAEASVPPARQLLPVAIASDPPEARIEVEGSYAGKTPATIRLQPGEYRVTLIMSGYEDWTGKITVRAGTPGAVAAAMKAVDRYSVAKAR